MKDTKFTNRDVDKLSMKKSKEYLWKYMEKKTALGKAGVETEKGPNAFFQFLKSLFTVPKRLVSVSGVAIVLVLAILAINLDFDIPGLQTGTVYASFEMEADSEDAGGIDDDTSFTLKASEDLDEDLIKDNLEVYPETEIKVERVAAGEYKVSPVNELETDSVYSFAIMGRVKDEVTGEEKLEEFSWAYQVKDSFKVTGTLPADHATSVPRDTGIEFYLRHDNFDVDTASEFFKISPSTKGSFEKHGSTLTFVPNGYLTAGTIYTATLKAGFGLEDSDLELEEDYEVRFETNFEIRVDESDLRFKGNSYEIGTEAPLALKVYNYTPYGEDPIESTNIDVYKFSSQQDYLAALAELDKVPNWCYYSRKYYRHDVSDLTKIGTYEAMLDEINWTDYLYVPDHVLEEGYYIVQFDDYDRIEQAFLQVTDLSAYIEATETDTLVWVNDLKTGNQVKDAEVELVDLEETYTTNANGIVSFDTNEEWKNEYSDHSTERIKISTPDGKSLITSLAPYSNSSASQYYWTSMSTDRPMYKSDDTVKFWGFIKSKDGYDAPVENLEIRLSKGWNSTSIVEKIPVKLSENNTYFGEINLDHAETSYYYLQLYAGDELIESLNIEVYDYTKPPYQISVTTNKNAVFTGEMMTYDIETTFFDGTPVSNIDLDYNGAYKWWDGEFTTDVNGEASFSVRAPKYHCISKSFCSNTENAYFDVRPTNGEESDIYGNSSIRIFQSKIALDAKSEIEDSQAVISMQTNWVDLSRINDETNESYDDYLGDIASGRTITGDITEISWEKTENGQYYDFINKKVVKTYKYYPKDTYLKSFSSVTDRDGEAQYKFDIDSTKNYRVNLKTADQNGNFWYDTVYFYGRDVESNSYDNYNIKILNGNEREYRQSFDIGDTVETAFYNGDRIVSNKDGGKFLFKTYNNGLLSYSIQRSPEFDFKFTDDHLPEVYISGVWFNGENYQTTWINTAYYDRDLKKLNVEITPDSESYAPGDEVTLEVELTDMDGDPVEAEVNLNLVDEAYYKVTYDYLQNPLHDIYSWGYSGILATYETHDSPLSAEMDEGGKGGCFVSGTQILMSDGSYKNIEDVRKGDMILTKSTYTSPVLVPAKVLSTIDHDVSEYIDVNNGQLQVTKEHVIFMNGGWDLAENLKENDVLIDKDGNEVRVNSLRVVKGSVKVHNFQVENYHTYIANNLFVHNDKGGGSGSVRDDFEDVALFDVIETDSRGHGEVTFELPDNITSWRVTAKAIDGPGLQAGVNVASIPVTLPVFGNIMMNHEYSINDEPVVKVRAFGDALDTGDKVEFKVETPTLGNTESETIMGEAYQPSYYELPELEMGKHDLVLRIESGQFDDALKEQIDVVGSRLEKTTLDFVPKISNDTEIELSGDHSTEVWFMNGGIGLHYYNLMSLYFASGDRLDQRLAQAVAGELMKKYFDENWSAYKDFDVTEYQDGGLKLLPYGDTDLELTALALVMDPNPSRYSDNDLKEYLDRWMDDAETLEEYSLALMGLASLHEPVLLNLRTLAEDEDLSVKEKLYIGLAFEKLGSKREAWGIYDEVSGELGHENPNAEETALGAVLAMALGVEDSAYSNWDDLVLTGIEDNIINLYQIGFLGHALKTASTGDVSFSVRFGDNTERVELGERDVFHTMVSPGETIKLSRLMGDIAMVTKYEEYIKPIDLETDERVNVFRKYYVDGVETQTFKEGDLVKVELTVDIDGPFEKTAFRVTDIVPSGMRPYESFHRGDRWAYTDPINFPYEINGQEVNFYWSKSRLDNTIEYYARVINPGKYYAEPAKIEAFREPEIVNISSSNEVEIDTSPGVDVSKSHVTAKEPPQEIPEEIILEPYDMKSETPPAGLEEELELVTISKEDIEREEEVIIIEDEMPMEEEVMVEVAEEDGIAEESNRRE